jgi:hypothetical protein
MSCSCCTSSIADGQILQSEFDHKVFNLQCRFKDYVANVTNKWRYGIFCPEDSDILIEIRALLRLLICYGPVTEEVPGDDSSIPDCYTEYLDEGGIDLNTSSQFPVNVGPNTFFFITSPNTGNYYILRSTAGTYTSSLILTFSALLFFLDGGQEVIAWPQGSDGSFFLEVQCSGTQESLDAALTAAQGVTVFKKGLPDADIIKIVQRIEKLLEC